MVISLGIGLEWRKHLVVSTCNSLDRGTTPQQGQSKKFAIFTLTPYLMLKLLIRPGGVT